MATLYDQGLSAVAAFEGLPWGLGTKFQRGPPSGRAARVLPDCLVTFSDGMQVPVEVKKTTTGISQLRPLAYHTTVVWRAPNEWWVLPPNDVVSLACDHAGQHCINPLECFNPGQPSARWQQWLAKSKEVPDRVRKAHIAGSASPLKREIQTFARQIEDLCNVQKQKVKLFAGAQPGHGIIRP